jgi:hypothetical protein
MMSVADKVFVTFDQNHITSVADFVCLTALMKLGLSNFPPKDEKWALLINTYLAGVQQDRADQGQIHDELSC